MRSFLTSVLIAFVFSAPLMAQTDCGWNPDYDGDNNIGVADLLGLLGVFEEQDSDDDGIFDSQDDCVGVYDPCGVCNGDGVDADLDGVCDDVDDCVGAYDECGVCNGPGPDWPVVESIEQFFDSVYIDQIDSWYVFQTGTDTTFTYVCAISGCTDTTAGNFNPDAVIDDGYCLYGPEQCGGLLNLTYDGYSYDLVAIGDQCWFRENLRTEHYANGDLIQDGLSDDEWFSTSTGATAIYNNDPEMFETYGRLYNWFAVDDIRGVCPNGWHVSSDEEWMALEMVLGMTATDVVLQGWRGTNQGLQLKASSMESPGWNGTNSVGFSALPAGRRTGLSFNDVGYVGPFWTSTPNGDNAWSRGLNSDLYTIGRNASDVTDGRSVRCVRN